MKLHCVTFFCYSERASILHLQTSSVKIILFSQIQQFNDGEIITVLPLKNIK